MRDSHSTDGAVPALGRVPPPSPVPRMAPGPAKKRKVDEQASGASEDASEGSSKTSRDKEGSQRVVWNVPPLSSDDMYSELNDVDETLIEKSDESGMYGDLRSLSPTPEPKDPDDGPEDDVIELTQGKRRRGRPPKAKVEEEKSELPTAQ